MASYAARHFRFLVVKMQKCVKHAAPNLATTEICQQIVIFEKLYLLNGNRSRPNFFADVLECYELHVPPQKFEIER